MALNALPAGESKNFLTLALQKEFADFLKTEKDKLIAEKLAKENLLVAKKLAAKNLLVERERLLVEVENDRSRLAVEVLKLKSEVSSVYEFRPLIEHFGRAWYAALNLPPQGGRVTATLMINALCERFFSGENFTPTAAAKLGDMANRAYDKQLSDADVDAIKFYLKSLFQLVHAVSCSHPR